MHNRAQPAAEASQCANEQGKFWEFSEKLFAAQQNLQDADFTKHATDLGLNLEAFNACYSSGKYRAEIQGGMKDNQNAGVSGTPAFLINGRFLSGAQPFDAFKTIIDDELSK